MIYQKYILAVTIDWKMFSTEYMIFFGQLVLRFSQQTSQRKLRQKIHKYFEIIINCTVENCQCRKSQFIRSLNFRKARNMFHYSHNKSKEKKTLSVCVVLSKRTIKANPLMNENYELLTEQLVMNLT